jgi:gamma-glutamyl-gamma-aminobutyrate hydrolase PuuD
MKTVLVSQRVDVVTDRNETRDALDQKLVRFILDLGLVPIPVPNGLLSAVGETRFFQQISGLNPHAIVLSGGNDLGQFPDRDSTERVLLKFAIEMRRPTLGICRGMQLICCYFGGQLVETNGHVASRHSLLDSDGRTVNSFHNFGLHECPSGLRVDAFAPDGTIEAVRAIDHPIFGIMWHPERESPFDSVDVETIREFFEC